MSVFESILRQAVESVPGAIGASFAAWDGEPVSSFAPKLPSLDVEILGAQWGIVWAQLLRSLEKARLGRGIELLVDGERASVLVRGVTEQYYVVLACGSHAHLATAQRALEQAVASLRLEMG